MIKSHETYRDKEEIISAILNAAKESKDGIKKQRLLYASRLNSEQLYKYLELLQKTGLLRVDSSTGIDYYKKSKGTIKRKGDTYRITQCGLQYLLLLDEMQRSMPGIAGIHI
jgi:predicted transcriptional regulator